MPPPNYNPGIFQNPTIYPNRKRINASPRNVDYEEGTGAGTGRNARRKDPGMGGGLDTLYLSNMYKDMPMSRISREANIRRNQGLMFNPNTGTYQNDSMYNRSGFGFGRGQMGGGRGQQAPAMTEPQQMWAQKAREKMSGVGALGKIGEKMASMVNPMFGAGLQAGRVASAMVPEPMPQAAPRVPFFRNPEASARELAAEKQMMSDVNSGIERYSNRNTSSFSSPYGRGSATTAMAPGKPLSRVKDDFGNWVPMNPYLKNKQAVQRTKGMI